MTELQEIKQHIKEYTFNRFSNETSVYTDDVDGYINCNYRLLDSANFDYSIARTIVENKLLLDVVIDKFITSDRRYDRYFSFVYQHKTSKKLYLDKNCYCVGGDNEFRGYCENLVEISEEQFQIIKQFTELNLFVK